MLSVVNIHLFNDINRTLYPSVWRYCQKFIFIYSTILSIDYIHLFDNFINNLFVYISLFDKITLLPPYRHFASSLYLPVRQCCQYFISTCSMSIFYIHLFNNVTSNKYPPVRHYVYSMYSSIRQNYSNFYPLDFFVSRYSLLIDNIISSLHPSIRENRH